MRYRDFLVRPVTVWHVRGEIKGREFYRIDIRRCNQKTVRARRRNSRCWRLGQRMAVLLAVDARAGPCASDVDLKQVDLRPENQTFQVKM